MIRTVAVSGPAGPDRRSSATSYSARVVADG